MSDTHPCPCGCGRQIERRRLACKPGWYRLPAVLRDRIWAAYRNDPVEHRRALAEAYRWYQDDKRKQNAKGYSATGALVDEAVALQEVQMVSGRRSGKTYLSTVLAVLHGTSQELHAFTCPAGVKFSDCRADDCVMRRDLLDGRLPQ